MALVIKILDILESEFSLPQPPGAMKRPLLDAIIRTLLSQKTTSSAAENAFHALKQLGDWATVISLGRSDIESAIRPAGLASQKTSAILQILKISEKHQFSLEHIRELNSQDVMDELLALPGVGQKTASCVMLFTLGMDVLPVDTHVHRVSKRLGWLSENTPLRKAQQLLEPQIPEQRRYAAHVLLFEHGRRYCRSQRPRCGDCPILRFCAYGQAS